MPETPDQMTEKVIQDLIASLPQRGKEWQPALWHAHPQTPSGFHPASGTVAKNDAFAHIRTQSSGAAQSAATDLLIRSLHHVVTWFEQSDHFRAMEERLRTLEATTGAMRAQLDELLHRLKGNEAREQENIDLEQYLPLIRHAFTDVFGDRPDLILRQADEPGGPMRLTLDASGCDPVLMIKSRAEGGRGRFYDMLLEQMPPDALDNLDFEFIFPRS